VFARFGLTVALLAGFSGRPAAAATLTWPGVAPCATTLQACITGAGSTDIVEVASNGPIVENLTIDKSLTLRPAAGFSPVIDGFQFLQSTATAATIAVDGLTFAGRLRAAPGTADLTLNLTNTPVNTTGSFGVAIDISSGTFPPYGNVHSVVEGNTVNVTGGGVGDQCSGIGVGLIFDSGASTARVANNVVNVIGCGQGDAIHVLNGPGETLTADVIGNVVDATNTNAGIMLRNFLQTADSVLVVRAINNVVSGQLNEAGAPGAIVVSADGFEHIDATIVNNTLAYNDIGLLVSARTDLGASIDGVVANNVVAFGRFAIEPTVTVTEHHNLIFPDPSDEEPFVPGPGTIIADPLFVSASDFHLSGSSPAINHGDNAAVPGDIATDVEGNPRIQLAVVDMGAYEAATANVLVIPTLGHWGLLASGVALGLAGIRRLRRGNR
jgi:hypothetical protein